MSFHDLSPDSIPEKDFELKFSRSSGPGGQHANKVSTRVSLVFKLCQTEILKEEEKDRIREKYAGYIDKDGNLHLTESSTRSQFRNKKLVLVKLAELLNESRKKKKHRKPTKPSAAAKRRRLDQKKRRSIIKTNRKWKNVAE
ncbi:MAG TPA: aminoacyl-tRNA hydrolase [Flavobacteriales bacterium]|jgi:ribosome-associated protein|nr:aminoacyl-tRNA hydrolase [Flavobacteriales bacterium]